MTSIAQPIDFSSRSSYSSTASSSSSPSRSNSYDLSSSPKMGTSPAQKQTLRKEDDGERYPSAVNYILSQSKAIHIEAKTRCAQ
ncbi:hypothetical protein I312_101975 [Cryptococcus bacillisporus CA1280]|uniref:uncharacterized protein n=1 Tax=Cryptococcus bacillisporus CA1280 TaxID=1296109 RepID=UPI0033663911